MALTATKWEDRLLLDPDALTWVDVDVNKLLIDPLASGGGAYDTDGALFVDDSMEIISVSSAIIGSSDVSADVNKIQGFDITLSGETFISAKPYVKKAASQLEIRTGSVVGAEVSMIRGLASSIEGQTQYINRMNPVRAVEGGMSGSTRPSYDVSAKRSMRSDSYGHPDLYLHYRTTVGQKSLIKGTSTLSSDTFIDRPQTFKMHSSPVGRSISDFVIKRRVRCSTISEGKSEVETKFDASEEWMYDSFFI